MRDKYLDNVVTLTFDQTKCMGCGRCTEVCPHAVFKMVNGKAEMVDKNRCMECGACKKNCPFAAIEVREGVGCAYAIMLSKLTGKEISCGGESESGSGCCG